MTLSSSFFDFKYVLLLCLLGGLRLVWPRRHYELFVALSIGLVVGLATPRTLLVIGGITALFIFPLHRLKRLAVARNWPAAVSAPLVPVGIGLLVLLLVVFKMYQEFTVPWLGGEHVRAEVLMVVGFSYFIFRAISVLRIQSLLKLDERSPWKMLCYTLFPPTLASGPIQKYQDFSAQMLNPAPLTRALLYDAGYRLSQGYFRKVVLAAITDLAMKHFLARPLTPLTSTLVMILFYLYLYFDFAGYSDMAIGFGLLLGIRVPENFRKPFLATSISEFWRNWHITLVDWLRDNVYIPLGGMKCSRWWAGALALLIMFLCGLWHGLNVPFGVWGLWYGGWMALEAVSGTGPLPPAQRHGARYWGRVLWTNARVALACLLFLPGSDTMFKVFRGFANWRLA